MIPTLAISDTFLPWQFKIRNPQLPLIDHEHGGVGLNDPTAGLRGYDWTAEYDPDTANVYVYRDDLGPETRVAVYNRAGISRLGLAFDQNMRPTLCFSDGDGVHVWFYKSSEEAMGILTIPGASSPCITLDDRRPERVSESDVILSYMSGSNLCARVQREVYDNEHTLALDNPSELIAFGMTKELVMQWRIAN